MLSRQRSTLAGGPLPLGCEALLKWNRAAGITFPGLTRRRQKERAFCLEGV
ncbi:phage-related lysozyme-like domain-containing protein [Rhizobium etli bv. phaseoli str. IE4803]|nr:phage-related lysozyme-like domain-containing protein [Rhizobium etli bv. phaseoli str. IE4803]